MKYHPTPSHITTCYSSSLSTTTTLVRKTTPRIIKQHTIQLIQRRTSHTTTPFHHATPPPTSSPTSLFHRIKSTILSRPIEYLTIPCVAAFVGISTNYAGVQMLFYPIDYKGLSPNIRFPDAPYGIFGWQGVVPARTEKMAARLVTIVTRDLMCLTEVFGRLEPNVLGRMLYPVVLEAVERDCGWVWASLLRPVLPWVLERVVGRLQGEIDGVLDLPRMVMTSFVRDKIILVELFQKVGRVELDFLITSGFSFGALLGLAQMMLWSLHPHRWTLPVAGAAVGYITNAIAIKFLFEPADPITVGPIVLQGLFESRQLEVSEEFGHFMSERVLTPGDLLGVLVGQNEDEFYRFLRREVPYPVPEYVLRAVMGAIRTVATHPEEYEEMHEYIAKRLDIEETLSSRLKLLSPKNFENLLHPVFEEDEIILIVVGGLLGAVAGGLQTRMGWGGKGATLKAIATIVASLGLSGIFFKATEEDWKLGLTEEEIPEVKKVEEEYDSVIDRAPPKLRRRNTLIRTKDVSELFDEQ